MLLFKAVYTAFYQFTHSPRIKPMTLALLALLFVLRDWNIACIQINFSRTWMVWSGLPQSKILMGSKTKDRLTVSGIKCSRAKENT